MKSSMLLTRNEEILKEVFNLINSERELATVEWSERRDFSEFIGVRIFKSRVSHFQDLSGDIGVHGESHEHLYFEAFREETMVFVLGGLIDEVLI